MARRWDGIATFVVGLMLLAVLAPSLPNALAEDGVEGAQETQSPTEAPVIEPTSEPPGEPTDAPPVEPTLESTSAPVEPTVGPTEGPLTPTIEPTEAPEGTPGEVPGVQSLTLTAGPPMGFPSELGRIPLVGSGIEVSVGPGCGGHVPPYQTNTKALDFAVNTGTSVYNPGVGNATVTAIYNQEGFGGLMMELDHGNGLITYYAHLSGYGLHPTAGRALQPGDSVTVPPGYVIAYTGNTGGSTGPHLHFAATRNGSAVDLTGLPSIDWNPLLEWNDEVIVNCNAAGVFGIQDGTAHGSPIDTTPPTPTVTPAVTPTVTPTVDPPPTSTPGSPIDIIIQQIIAIIIAILASIGGSG